MAKTSKKRASRKRTSQARRTSSTARPLKRSTRPAASRKTATANKSKKKSSNRPGLKRGSQSTGAAGRRSQPASRRKPSTMKRSPVLPSTATFPDAGALTRRGEESIFRLGAGQETEGGQGVAQLTSTTREAVESRSAMGLGKTDWQRTPLTKIIGHASGQTRRAQGRRDARGDR